eukprot:746612-Hanusia_phi.AAC.3
MHNRRRAESDSNRGAAFEIRARASKSNTQTSMSRRFTLEQFETIRSDCIEEAGLDKRAKAMQDTVENAIAADTTAQTANENPMHRWKNKQKFSRSLSSLPVQRGARMNRLSSIGCEPVAKDVFDNFFGAEQDFNGEDAVKLRSKDDTETGTVLQCIKLSHPNSKSFSWGEHSKNVTNLANEDGRLNELLSKLRSFSKEND